MRRKKSSKASSLAWMGLALLACLGAAPTARANDPILVIHLAGGDSTIYAVWQVQRIVTSGDTIEVRTTSRSDRYPAAEVAKIVFRWLEPAGIKDPSDAAALIKAVHLFQNQPNPFSPETRIVFDLPKAGPVELAIYGVNGRLIRRLVKDTREVGRHTASWDGRDEAGEKAGSGIYFYQLVAQGVEESRRMILLP